MKYIILILLCVATLQAKVMQKTDGVEFSYSNNAKEVFVAGSFNNWNQTANKLTKNSQGVFATTINLGSGKHQYKFVVDGNWVTDEENPNTEDDGYGGTNSVVEVLASGNIKQVATTNQVTKLGISTEFNPKVKFDGRYRTINNFRKKDDKRLMLDKPEHDFNLGVKAKINQNVEAYTVMNINNNAENIDMWKSHLNFKRSLIKIKTNYFTLEAFDRFGKYKYNQPLPLIGNISQYNYNFGYEWRGIYGHSSYKLAKLPLNFDLQAIFADEAGDDYNADLSSGYLLANYVIDSNEESFFDVDLGFSGLNVRENTNNDIPKNHVSLSSDLNFTKNIFTTDWVAPMEFELNNQFIGHEVYNEYNKFGQDVNIIADEQTIEKGQNFISELFVKFPSALKVFANYKYSRLKFYQQQPADGENWVPAKNIFVDDTHKNTICFGFEMKSDDLLAKFELEAIKTNYPDTTITWANYYKSAEKQDFRGKFWQNGSYVNFNKYTILGYKKALMLYSTLGYKFDVFNRHGNIELNSSYACSDFFTTPKFMEHLLQLEYDLISDFSLLSNTRIAYYNDDLLGIKTDFIKNEHRYISNYSAIKYQIKNNIFVSIGWGVNPSVISSTSDEYYLAGRDEFLNEEAGLETSIDNGLYGLGKRIIKAEKALKDEQRISIEASLEF